MAQYLKPDCELGYIEDQAEIEKLKLDNLRHTILGCMLGDFDETGAYVVDPEIVKQLIEMPKYIVESMDNIEICKSVLKLDKQITFSVTFEGNKATLSLLEKLSFEANFAINSGTYSNINEYVLDTVETSGEVNRNAIYARWNIGEFDGNVIDVFNCAEEILAKYFGIVNRFKYLLKANTVLLEKEAQIEEVEAEYANSIFDILKHYPKLQNEVLKQIKENLKDKKHSLSVEKPNFAKTFNEILDNAIISNLNTLSDKEKEDFGAEKRNAVVNLNVKRSEVLETETHATKNDDEELNKKVVRLTIADNYSSRSLQDLGEEFVSANKNFEKNKDQKENSSKSEKDKLLDAIIGFGMGTMITGSVVVGAAVAAAGNLVVGAADKIANKDKSANSSKANGNKKVAGNNQNANKNKSTKPQTNKPKTKPQTAKKPIKQAPSGNSRDAQTQSQYVKRVPYGRLIGAQVNSNNKTPEPPQPQETQLFKMKTGEQLQAIAARARGNESEVKTNPSAPRVQGGVHIRVERTMETKFFQDTDEHTLT